MSTKENVVVFGGSGFLGSHVADALSERGYDVTIYDLKRSPYLRRDQDMIVGDVLDTKRVNEALKGALYAYNFSGVADIEECSKDPLRSITQNILGHTTIMDRCRANNIKRVVYASSVYVYGGHGSFYRITKQACEQIMEEYHARYGLNYTILRYGSLYGPRSQMWNGVYRYIYQAIKEKRIDYPGTGEEKREYIHVMDAAGLSADILNEKFKNKCMVITGTYTLSSKELLVMIKEMLNNEIEINFTNEASAHHYSITAHSFIPKIGSKIAPNPSIDMGEGVLQQIEEIYKRIKNEDLDSVTQYK